MNSREIGLSITAEARKKVVLVEKGVMARNNELADENRKLFDKYGLTVMNLLSSPGSGKTSLLARTLDESGIDFAVIVGDLATDNDAQRLKAEKRQITQIMTNGICHLEAAMVAKAAESLDLSKVKMLVIENVGNLVCPSSYYLGEDFRVVLLSSTEGEDKPLKYPTMFKKADVVIINKMDIAEAVEFKLQSARENILKIRPEAKIFELSAKTGLGMQAWYDYLKEKLA